MKPHTQTDDLYAARMLRLYEEPERRPWSAVLILLFTIGLLFWAWIFWPAG